MRGGLAFYRGIRCQNNFLDLSRLDTLPKKRDPNLFGAHSVYRRKMAHENEIEPLVTTGLFQGEHIGWRFYHTKLGTISIYIITQTTKRFLKKNPESRTAPDFENRLGQSKR